MKKIWVAPLVVLILMVALAGWSAARIWSIGFEEIPGGFTRLISLLIGVIITLCIVLVTIVGDLKLEKIPAKEIKEKPPVEEVPKAPEVPEAKPPEEVPPEVPKKEELPKPPPEEEMVVCGGCGALVPASSKKCPNCGAEFEE